MKLSILIAVSSLFLVLFNAEGAMANPSKKLRPLEGHGLHLDNLNDVRHPQQGKGGKPSKPIGSPSAWIKPSIEGLESIFETLRHPFLSIKFDRFNPKQFNKFIGNSIEKMSLFRSKFYDCPERENSEGDGMAIISADPYDCAGYYYCVWGVPQLSKCSWPLFWNDNSKSCDWFYNVDCEDKVIVNRA